MTLETFQLCLLQRKLNNIIFKDVEIDECSTKKCWKMSFSTKNEFGESLTFLLRENVRQYSFSENEFRDTDLFFTKENSLYQY